MLSREALVLLHTSNTLRGNFGKLLLETSTARCCGGSALVWLWVPALCLGAHPAVLSSLFYREPDRGDPAEPCRQSWGGTPSSLAGHDRLWENTAGGSSTNQPGKQAPRFVPRLSALSTRGFGASVELEQRAPWVSSVCDRQERDEDAACGFPQSIPALGRTQTTWESHELRAPALLMAFTPRPCASAPSRTLGSEPDREDG